MNLHISWGGNISTKKNILMVHYFLSYVIFNVFLNKSIVENLYLKRYHTRAHVYIYVYMK